MIEQSATRSPCDPVHPQLVIYDRHRIPAHFAGPCRVIDRGRVVARPIQRGIVVVDIEGSACGRNSSEILEVKRCLPRDGAGDVDACHGCAAIGFGRKVVRDGSWDSAIGSALISLISPLDFRTQLADRHGEGRELVRAFAGVLSRKRLDVKLDIGRFQIIAGFQEPGRKACRHRHWPSA